LFSMSIEEARFKASLLMNVANAIDLTTTVAGLEAGLKEGNPLARYIIKEVGLPQFSLFKLAFPLILSSVSELAITPKSKAAYGLIMSALATVFALASINNILLLSLRRAMVT